MTLRFGTDGWRGVIAEEFTLANVAVVAQAIADALPGGARPVVVGYDTRFASRTAAELVAEVLAANGFEVLLGSGPVPTPAVSFAVRAHGAVAGVVVTASHNPYWFNGLKLKADFGGSAPPELTARVEAALGRTPPRRLGAAKAAARITTVDLLPAYLEGVGRLVVREPRPVRPLTVIADPLYGAVDGLLARLLPPAWGSVRVIHDRADPLFGGLHPEPIPPHLDPLAAEVRRASADLGLATDGDGDRLGVIGPDGSYVSPHQVLALLLLHLHRHRGWRGEVVKGFAVGVQTDRLCERLGLVLHVTPIGFKHIAPLMLSRDILIGGEESGGVGFKGHLPERDGLLTALFLLECLVMEGKGLPQLVAAMEAEAGPAVYQRRDYHLPPEVGRRLLARLDQAPPARLGGERVVRREDLDGRKLWLADGAWVLIRPSGTEPVLRVYIEAPEAGEVEALHAAAADLVRSLAGEREGPASL